VYGGLDVTGLARHNQVVIGQLRTSEWIALHGWGSLPGAFLSTTFRSFWAQFGWMAVPIDSRIYLALILLSGAAALGFVVWLVGTRRETGRASPVSVLLVSSGLLTLATYLGYNLGFYQAQGRYLFPALIPIGLAWSLGLWESLRRPSAQILGILLGLATAVSGLRLVVGAHDDKWQVLILGLGSAYWGAAWWLPVRSSRWLPLVPYLFLALVCAVSPFWFIAPHLTP
jgi:hypothetical protein